MIIVCGNDSPRYDDIVVGSGAAGAVIAARLSEDSGRRVLLLEAGPDYPSIEATPPELLSRRQPIMTGYGWGYQAVPFPGRVITFARGKVIGGSTAVNGAVALRGLAEDFDRWEDLGNPGWGWRDVLPYFRKIETDRDFQGPLHGDSGPLPIWRTPPDSLTPFHRAFVEACRQDGRPEAPDHNDTTQSGIGPLPLNIDGERRISTAIAYLLPARGRSNLTILADCQVWKVLFDGDRAAGVSVLTASGEEEIHAGRVILAGGAIGSPFILLHSGIGPRDRLSRLGIETRADLPGVGANLIDHPSLALPLISADGLDPDIPAFQVMLRYTSEGSPDRNDLQIMPFVNMNASDPKIAEELRRQKGLPLALLNQLERPKSRGSVRLTSADPRAIPDIDLNLLDNPEDLRRLLSGIRYGWRISHSSAMAGVVAGVEILDQTAVDSDELLTTFVRERAAGGQHPAGTARMGLRTDPGAVVDARGRIHGLENLWVADASIMPDIPRANTNLTCIMIGERIADLLRADAG